MSSGQMEDVDKKTVRDVLNVVLRSNNLQGKGDLVTKRHTPTRATLPTRAL